ncbi:MAG: hypothetical protein JRH20_29145, partial [Deltaproteobacteria bacterium]|nr:hypothetical protein [Deltaproteobacteria bacterium]
MSNCRWSILFTCLFGLLFAGCPTDEQTHSDAQVAGPDGPVVAQVSVKPCQMTTCEDGVASVCETGQTLECVNFGAQCESFSAEGGGEFPWCNCGTVPDGQGKCLGPRTGVVCQGGYGRMGGCPEGSTCKEDLSAPLGITCECDDAS